MKKILIVALVVLTPLQAQAGGGTFMKAIGRSMLIGGATLAAGLTWWIGSLIHGHYEEKALIESVLPYEIDEVPKQDPPPGEAKVAKLGGRSYFIKDDYVLSVGPERVFESEGKRKAISLQPYQNVVVAGVRGGGVSMYLEGHWFDFSDKVRQVITTKDSIVALSAKGEIWVLKAAPGKFHVHSVTTTTSSGYWQSDGNGGGFWVPTTSTTTNYYLNDSNGRGVELVKNGMRDVNRIEPVNGDVKIIFNDGTSRLLSETLARR